MQVNLGTEVDPVVFLHHHVLHDLVGDQRIDLDGGHILAARRKRA